jgi:hypothetical protein
MYYDLGPTVAANPGLADAPAGFCFGIRAIYAPGTSAYVGSGGTYNSAGGNMYLDNVIIYVRSVSRSGGGGVAVAVACHRGP